MRIYNEKLIRLQKYLSSCGIISRRGAETLIINKKISINGKCAKLGDKVDPGKDIIKIGETTVKIKIKKINYYIALYKPKGYVTSMISINSKEFKNCIISGGFDNMIKIINIENNTITDLKGHNNTVISLCLVKNNYLYSGSLDHTFRKWNLELRQCENINEDHNSLINNICEMKDGLILTTGYDMKIRIWDNHLKNIKTFSYKNGRIDTCCSIGGSFM